MTAPGERLLQELKTSAGRVYSFLEVTSETGRRSLLLRVLQPTGYAVNVGLAGHPLTLLRAALAEFDAAGEGHVAADEESLVATLQRRPRAPSSHRPGVPRGKVAP